MAKNFFDWNLEGWMCDFWHICDSAAFPDQCKSYHGGQICVVVFMEVKKNDTFKAEYSKNLYTCFRVFNCCFRCPVTGLYITTPFKLQDVSSISNDHFPSIKSLQDTLKIPTHAFSCLLHSVLHRAIHRNGTNWHIRMNMFLQCEWEHHVSNFFPEAQNKEEGAFVSARHTYSDEVSLCCHWYKMN